MGLFSSSYDSLCDKGIKALEADELEKARLLFMQAIKRDTSRARAFGWVGMVYQQLANEWFMSGDEVKSREYGEWAVKAFDEAISRETNARQKAENWWQKGVALGGLGRLEERDACCREADKIVPGYSDKRGAGMLDALKTAIREVAELEKQKGKS